MSDSKKNNAFCSELSRYLSKPDYLDMWEMEPVPLHVFLYDKKYLNIGISLSDQQFEAIQYSTQILRPKEMHDLGWKPVRYVSEIYLQWGKGSGKDLISMLTSARIADLLLCMRNPQSYWGLPSFANIDLVNMAYNSDQAKFNFYEPMRKMICSSKRFKHLADDKDRCIHFAKSIYAHSGHSDEDAIEGKNLMLAVLDEISAFKTKAEFSKNAQRYRAPKYSYEALIDAMKSSMQSRFDTGKLIAISYPRYKGCPIQQLYNAGKRDNKMHGESSRVYVSFGCTWEVNPIKKREMFDIEFKRNPNLVKAKYMCDPQRAEDSYIKNADVIDETFPDVAESLLPHTLGDYPVLRPGFKAKHNFGCSVHVDLGLNNCRAGIAMTHQYGVREEKVVDAETGEEVPVELPLVGIDIVASFQAQPGEEIDFSEIRKFIFSLKAAGFHISIISYDQWNSIGERQILERAGFNVVRRSVDLDRSMYDDLVIMMGERRITGGYAAYRMYTFAGQIMKTCIIKEELQGLVDLRGKKIDHRLGGTKDEADALVGSVRGAVEFGVWRFGVSTPHGESLPQKQRAMEADKSESKIVERLKAMNGAEKLPDSFGFRGNPIGIR